MIGNGIRAGATAFLAMASMTLESLPPEKSRHGRDISAATSRKMKMLSASRLRRWLRTWDFKGLRISSRRRGGSPKVSSRRAPRVARRLPRARGDMTLDIPLAIGGLLVGTIVGLTGMG